MRMTRAGQVVALGRVEFVEAPVEPLREGDLRVRSRFASICGSDLHTVNHGVETEPRLWAPGYPGHEGVGEVVESRAPGYAPGDRVLVVPPVPESRCFAEWQRVRASSTVRLDGDLPPLAEVLMASSWKPRHAAGQHPWNVAGRTVVVIGQGSAGLFWAWSLKQAGTGTVIVADRAPARLAAAAHFGADVVVDVRADDLGGGHGPHPPVKGPASSWRPSAARRPCSSRSRCAAPAAASTGSAFPALKRNRSHDFRLFFRRKLSAFSTFGARTKPGLEYLRLALEHVPGRRDRRTTAAVARAAGGGDHGRLPAGRPLRRRGAQGVGRRLTGSASRGLAVRPGVRSCAS